MPAAICSRPLRGGAAPLGQAEGAPHCCRSLWSVVCGLKWPVRSARSCAPCAHAPPRNVQRAPAARAHLQPSARRGGLPAARLHQVRRVPAARGCVAAVRGVQGQGARHCGAEGTSGRGACLSDLSFLYALQRSPVCARAASGRGAVGPGAAEVHAHTRTRTRACVHTHARAHRLPGPHDALTRPRCCARCAAGGAGRGGGAAGPCAC